MTLAQTELEALVDAVEDGVVVFARGAPGDSPQVIHVNAAYVAMVGRRAEDLVGRALEDVLEAGTRHDRQALRDALAMRRPVEVGLEHRAPDGELHPVRLRLCPLSAGLTAGIVRDLSPIRDLLRDGLTGLLSRGPWTERAEALFAGSRRHGWPLAMAMIDLDHFKQINDRFGHATGDAVLRAVGRACRGSLRGSDVIGRIGGEELAWIAPETDLVAASSLWARVGAAVRQLRVPGPRGPVQVTMSVGVAERGEGDHDLAVLMARADAALYRAKHAGRDQIAIA